MTLQFINSILKFRFHVAVLYFLLMLRQLLPMETIETTSKFLVALSFGSLTFAIYILNKLTDHQEDSINNKKDAVTTKHLKAISIICGLLFVAPFLYILAIDAWLIVVYIGAALLGILYSYRFKISGFATQLKRILLLKNISSALGWSTTLVIVPVILGKAWNEASFIQLIVLFLIVFAIEIMWDFKDIKGDLAQGIKTVPNQFGIFRAKWIVLAVLLASIVLMIIYRNSPTYLISAVIVGIGTACINEKTGLWYYHTIVFIWLAGMTLEILIL